MTEDEILEYVNKTNLPENEKAALYDELMAAPNDAERELVKQQRTPKYSVSADNTAYQPKPIPLSTNPNDDGYWEKLSSKQLMDAARQDPFSGVINPDGSFNQQAYGKWVGELARESIAQKRKNIANADYEGANWLEKVGAVAGKFFMPRVHEAYERGEEPAWKDYGLDLTQNVAYALPVGMAAGAIARGMPLAARLGASAASNFAVPAVMEGLDRIAYAGEENTDRSRFSLNDVLVGGAVNLGTPLFFKGAGAAIGAANAGYQKSMAMDVANALRNFGVDPKATALETIKEAEASIAAKELPAYATVGGKPRPFVNLETLGVDGMNMEAMDALNTRAVGRGIEDGSIRFVPSEGKVLIDAPNHVVDENGILRKVGVGDGAYHGDVNIGGKAVGTSPVANNEDRVWAGMMDKTSPQAYWGTNREQVENVAASTINAHPELAKMGVGMRKRIEAQAPMNYGTNMLGKSEYAKKGEAAVPLLSDAIEATKVSEREERWANGEATFKEKQSPEYMEWWYRHNKHLVGLE